MATLNDHIEIFLALARTYLTLLHGEIGCAGGLTYINPERELSETSSNSGLVSCVSLAKVMKHSFIPTRNWSK